jgi:hypothetical protein
MAIQSYSVQFNGTTQYLSMPIILDSSGDLTIEAWVYITATPSANGAFILGQYVGAGADRTIFNVDSTLKAGFQVGAVSMGSTTTLSLNTWYHLAVVRSGGASNNMALYVNGTKEGQMTYTGAFQNTNTTIGYTPNLANTYLTGYISNLRIVKGTAVYTANFTAPVSPLTVITNTALLTCNSPTIVDNSGNNVTITLNGSPTVTTFIPFFVTGLKLRNTIPQTYSVTFNGSTQYLKLPSNASAWTLTGDFTMECWINVANTSQNGIFTMNWSGDWNAASNGFSLSSNVIVTPAGNITWTSPSINTWHHLAAVRSGTTITVYLDGTSVASGTNGNQFGNSSVVPGIGLFDTNPGVRAPFSGNISNFRLVKGTAVYTGNFTPPTLPLSAVAGTSLLTCNAATIVDSSTNNFTITPVASPAVSIQTPFGPNYSNRLKVYNTIPTSYSVSFNGTTDYLTLTGVNLSGANFTIEGWVYFNSFVSNAAPHVFNFGADSNNRYVLWRSNTSGKFNLGTVNAGTFTLTDGLTTPSTGVWYHVAFVRNGSTNYMYINGTQDATSSTGISTGTSWAIGTMQFSPAGNYLNGYVSNFRVIAGTAVYTGNFTPPTVPLPVIANTSLLTCNDSTIRDASTNNRTITQNGSPTVSTRQPFGSNFSARLKIYSVT